MNPQFAALTQFIDRALDRSLPTNIVDKGEGFEIAVKVPGVARKDIAVDIQGRFVKVSVGKAASSVSDDNSAVPAVHLAEFEVPARAERVFQFREALDTESAALDLKDGILTIGVAYQQRGSKRTLTLAD